MGDFLSKNVKKAWFLEARKTCFPAARPIRYGGGLSRGAPDPLRGRTEPRRARSVTGAAD